MPKRGNRKNIEVVLFDTPQVMAASVAAYRINKGYIRNVYDLSEGQTLNRNLIVQIISNDMTDVLPEDYALAGKITEYYQGKLLDLMSGKINDYGQKCINLVNSQHIANIDSLNLGVMASIPSAYEKALKFDKQLDTIEHYKHTSKPIGPEGTSFKGLVKVIQCFYSKNYFRYYINAATNDGILINFASNTGYETGEYVAIASSRLKKYVENINRLHYVRVVKKEIDESA